MTYLATSAKRADNVPKEGIINFGKLKQPIVEIKKSLISEIFPEMAALKLPNWSE